MDKNVRRLGNVSPDQRASILLSRQKAKMASSPHAYVRGNTAQFYQWLKANPIGLLPDGPPIWICGDCHNGNLGPVGGTDGKISIQIRDLDQSVIGNPAHDLIRLSLSLASAIRGSDLPGVTTARMLEQIMLGYESAFDTKDDLHPSGSEIPEVVSLAMKKAWKRSWKHLAKERLENSKPTIPLSETFWGITVRERKELEAIFDKQHVQRLATMLHSRPDDAKVEFIDAAYWMKGCSSLGKLRYAVLLSVSLGGKEPEYCLMDVKEAISSAAIISSKSKMPADNAERVIEGARHLSPALGDRMRAAQMGDKSVFIRELLPQDLKIEIETLSKAETMRAGYFLASVVGKAHARQMDSVTAKSWLGDISKHRSRSLEAPSWLWTSVTQLLVDHEGTYLEHCRQYALSPKEKFGAK